MAAKRFLGLGFTFTATDKGLEKKLQSLSGLVKDINSGLKSLSGNADDAGKSVGKMPMPKGSKKSKSVSESLNVKANENLLPKSAKANVAARVAEGATQAVASNTPAVTTQAQKPSKAGGLADKTIKEALAKERKELKELLTQNFPEDMSKGVIEAFNKGLAKATSLEKDQAQATKEGLIAAVETLEAFTKVKLESLEIKKYFDAVGDYLRRVRDSFENFLDSIGINFRQMFPKELIAAFGLLKTVVQPLTDFAKASMKKGAEFVLTKIGNSNTRLAKESLKVAKKHLDRFNGVFGAAQDSTTGALRTDEVGGPEKQKKGLFGRIWDALKGLFGTLGTGILAFGAKLLILKKVFDLLKTPLKSAKAGFSALGKMITLLVGKIKAGALIVGGYLTTFGKAIAGVARFVASLFTIKTFAITTSIVALGAALFGIGKTLWDGRDRIFRFFSELGTTISLVGGIIFDKISNVFSPVTSVLGPVFSSLASGLKTMADAVGLTSITFTGIIDAITKAVKAFVDFFAKTLGSAIGGRLLGLFDSMSRGLSNVNQDLRRMRDSGSNRLLLDQGTMTKQSNMSSVVTPMTVQTEPDPANEQVADNTQVLVEQNQRLIQLQEQMIAQNARQNNGGNAANRNSQNSMRDFIRSSNTALATSGGTL